jgi:hypothetical protein
MRGRQAGTEVRILSTASSRSPFEPSRDTPLGRPTQHPERYGVTSTTAGQDSIRVFVLTLGGAAGSDTLPTLDGGGEMLMVVRTEDTSFDGWWGDAGVLAPRAQGYFCAARTTAKD